MVMLFSVAAFFIVLREVLEASIIVGVMLAYLNRIGATQYRKWVWIGTLSGILVCIAVGLTFGILFYATGHQWFDDFEAIFEGLLFLASSALLTGIFVWMAVVAKELRSRVEDHFDNIISREDRSPFRQKLSIFSIVFLQILREGIECVIFLIGTANADSVGGWRSIPIPGILAIICAITMTYLVFKGLIKLDVTKVLQVASVITMIMAAGLISLGVNQLQEAEWFGTFEEENDRPWWNSEMWSMKKCCDHTKNEFFGMLRSLIGYQDTPTFVEFCAYFLYWFLIVSLIIIINWGPVQAHRTKTLHISHHLILWNLLFTFVGFIFCLINITWIGTTISTIGFTLSLLSVVTFFDAPIRLFKPLRCIRRRLALIMAIVWTLYSAAIIVLHFITLDCEGKGELCSFNKFYFFGIILSSDFNELGQQSTYWPGLAVLSVSLIFSIFFYSILTFTLWIVALNINTDGYYNDDNALPISEEDSLDAMKLDDLPGI